MALGGRAPRQTCIGDRAGGLAAGPAVPVHHGEPIAEDVDAREPAVLEDIDAGRALEECETHEHDDARTQVQCMRNEPVEDSAIVWRIRQYAFAASRHLRLCQKVGDEVQRKSVIDQVGGDDGMPGGAEFAHDGAFTGGGLPDAAGE